MQQRIIDQWGRLRFCLSESPDAQIAELLANTLYGTPGHTVYQHLNVEERLQQIRHARYLSLRKGDNLIAVLVLCRRDISLSTGIVPSYYIRYFSIHPSFQRRSVKEGNARNRLSLIQRSMLDLLAQPEKLEMNDPTTGKAIFYAYVELENERSFAQTRLMGFEKISDFSTVALSRYSPKKDPRVWAAGPEDHELIRKHLRKIYGGHAFYFEENLFQAGNFYLLKESDLIAGVAVHRVEFKVHHLPGFSGKLMLKLLPVIPGVSRIFNPKEYRFLATDSCFWPEGREDLVQPLLESALHQEQRNAALLWTDRRDPFLPILRSKVRLGLINRFREEVPVDVILKCQGLTEAEKSEVLGRPTYLSALDMT